MLGMSKLDQKARAQIISLLCEGHEHPRHYAADWGEQEHRGQIACRGRPRRHRVSGQGASQSETRARPDR